MPALKMCCNTYIFFADPPVVAVKVAPGMDTYQLKEGDQIQFICKIRSNPEPTIVAWFHGVSIKILLSRKRCAKGKIGLDNYRNLRVTVSWMTECGNSVYNQSSTYRKTIWNIEFRFVTSYKVIPYLDRFRCIEYAMHPPS